MLVIFLECLCNISEKCMLEYFWKVFEKQLTIFGIFLKSVLWCSLDVAMVVFFFYFFIFSCYSLYD
jgi:hypothetical protein